MDKRPDSDINYSQHESCSDSDSSQSEPIFSNFVHSGQTRWQRLLGQLNYYDHVYSRKLQTADNLACNVVLGFGGWCVNRAKMLVQYPLLMWFTYNRAGDVVKALGVKELEGQLDDPGVRWKLAKFMGAYQFALVAGSLLAVLAVKALTNRDRPKVVRSVTRLMNMRDREPHKSMPSGDALLSALFSAPYVYIFGYKWLPLVAIPLVCLGRVYMHCHWLGDVIVGAIGGIVIGHLAFGPYFKVLSKPFLDKFVLNR